MTSPLTKTAPTQGPPGRADRDRLRSRVQELFTPIEPPRRWRVGGQRTDRPDPELSRARRAAARAFKVTPSRSKRKAAAVLLSTGAAGLTAFTVPPTIGSSAEASAKMPRPDQRVPAEMLRASDEMKDALVQEEGMRRTVYRDVAGYATVGIGHLVRPTDGLRIGDRISRTQALAFLDADLHQAERDARELLGDLPVHQHEFDALVDLIYNVGAGNVSAHKSPALNQAIAQGDYQAIADELVYTRAAGRYARGLDFRSERRTQIFMNASYDDPRAESTLGDA